ncbi:ferritin family protein [Thermococcus sp.]|uniref:ferritin family protein n=1 Tax=Thermococcus sp. TaxID=35749 RepID=UPI0026323E63|nr:ferritin family protein [Thermococcus sp.]
MVEFSEEEKGTIRGIVELLGKLDKRSLMSYWINSEFEEAGIYNGIAKRFAYYGWDPRVPKLFEELAKESLNSAEALLMEYKSIYGNAPLTRPEMGSITLKLSRGKLEDYLQNGRLRDLVEILMEGEKLASEIYEYLAENSKGELRGMLRRLASIENGHYLRLKALMDSLEEE